MTEFSESELIYELDSIDADIRLKRVITYFQVLVYGTQALQEWFYYQLRIIINGTIFFI